MATTQSHWEARQPLPSLQREVMSLGFGQAGAGTEAWAHLLGLIVLILIRLLAVLLLEFGPLFEGLLLRAGE